MSVTKANLYIACVNYRYGDNAFLPYAGARLWAYAKAQAELADTWHLAELLWEREPLLDVLTRMRSKPPDCLALSTYIWNEEWNLALAKLVRVNFPNCVTVVGGPQVPNDLDTCYEWQAANGINVAIRGEGEETFAEVLGAIRTKACTSFDCVAFDKSRIESLASLPSPYLSGVLDELVRARPDIKWQALQETNRGCPYQCTFCDWGSATYDKVRRFPMRMLVEELEWFAAHRVELLYNCDANFGMLPACEEFTAHLLAVARRTGYPHKFRAAYAKKINDRVFGVAHAIAEAGLSKGATISFQSMHAPTLAEVKRLNPVQKDLASTFARYRRAKIPTYTELIVGLPGETLETFKDGIDELLRAGQHDGLAVYPCMGLRNSELSRPAYRTQHGIRTRTVHLLLLHGVQENDPAPERYDLVTETATMPFRDWVQAWQFGIVVQALHCSGITREHAQRAYESFGMRYRDYYDALIRRATTDAFLYPNEELPLDVALRKALQWWRGVLFDALDGKPWRTVLPEFGPVQWPPEEAVRLIVSRELGLVPREMSTEEWAREVVWYGRKGGQQERREAA